MLHALIDWHSLAKLMIHTESTVSQLETATSTLGDALRTFKYDVCPQFATKETPSEVAKRQRRAQKARSRMGESDVGSSEKHPAVAASSGDAGKSVPKSFNMSTYKLHALGDYVDNIRKFGVIINYSTQLVRHFPL
jgi:hypothetical protein